MTLAAGAITAAVIATDAIDGDALAASAVSEIQAGLSTLDASGVRAAVGLATANLDAQLGDLPTNAELTAALGTADDAVLSAIAGLNDLSSGEAQTAAAAALTAYDAATGTDVTAATSGLSTLDAAGVRTAVGLSAANLDTQLDNMPTNSELTAATSGLSTLTAAQVWNYVTRELTSGGGGGGGITAADVWAYATRELTGKTGFSLTSAYDPAKTAAQQGDEMTLAAGELSGLSTLTAQQVWEYATRTLTAGSGVTAQQVWEYATRTLTSGGGGGGGASAAEIWEYATRTLTQPTMTVDAGLVEGTMSIYRGDTFGVSFTGLGSLTGRSALYVTAKSDTKRADDEAVFDVSEAGGLLRLNGAATTSSWGSVTVADAATGAVNFTLKAQATSALKPGTYLYDIQVVIDGGVTTIGRGSVIVTADIKRATS